MSTTLSGIAWDHSRGFTSAVAASQRLHELNPKIDVRWAKRSLLDFGEYSVERLVEDFDLLIIDHPFIGHACAKQLFLPLDLLLGEMETSNGHLLTVGASFASYSYHGQLWAVPIDTACPVAAFRRDCLEDAGQNVPQTWSELLKLADQGRVIYPAIPTDAIHHFYMLCHALGETPFSQSGSIVRATIASDALTLLQDLYQRCPKLCGELNPIQVFDELTNGSTYWYCPFAFGYNNYGRSGYGKARLEFGSPPEINAGTPAVTTLGGCGLAISSHCKSPQLAAEVLSFMASGPVQSNLYFYSGGQPAHRDAWLNQDANDHCGNFFNDTLASHERAWLRPRYHGYLNFQDLASHSIYRCQVKKQSITQTVEDLESFYTESRKIAQATMHPAG